jgi:hypothetical protein
MMEREGIFCSGCGITLRPFMQVCPRCGARREAPTPIEKPPPESISASAPPEPYRANYQVPVGSESKSFGAIGDIRYSTPARNMVFLSPQEEQRRFPLFTAAQWTLIAIGAGLLVMMIVIAYLLWRQQQRDTTQPANRDIVALQPSPNATTTPNPSPTPTPSDDQAIYESVKTQLMAYNPLGFSRYSFEVKDGIVTVNGEAGHQPEKDGVGNVVKLISGVKSVINNLKIKPNGPTGPNDSLAPVKLNLAEAKILDDALRREVESRGQSGAVEATKETQQPKQTQQSDAQREARERAAAKQREEDMALRKAAEEKLRREAEENERRQEELRRAEAERRAGAEQSRLVANALRSGTVAWSGTVDGVDEVVISGSSASVRHVIGAPPREVKASFSAPIPRSPVSVALISANGRGVISVVQQPSAANGYTAIVRIDDSAKGGDKRYEFTLRWSAQ